MRNYIAVPANSADRTAIFGRGNTPEEALSDAVEWTGGDTNGLTALECTPALRAEIEANGSPLSWSELPDGTQCTVEEEEEGWE